MGVMVGGSAWRSRSLAPSTDGCEFAIGPHQAQAFQLAFQAMEVSVAHKALKELAEEPAHLRWLIWGSGITGDPTYVPWLIRHMADDTDRPPGR